LSVNIHIIHLYTGVFSIHSGYISIYKDIQYTGIFNIHSGYISIYKDIQYTFRIYIYIQGCLICIQDLHLNTGIFNIHSGYISIYKDIQYTFWIYIYIQGYSMYIQDIYLYTGNIHDIYLYKGISWDDIIYNFIKIGIWEISKFLKAFEGGVFLTFWKFLKCLGISQNLGIWEISQIPRHLGNSPNAIGIWGWYIFKILEISQMTGNSYFWNFW